MSRTKDFPLYIPNRASELRVKSAKSKMSGVRSRSKRRRAKSARGTRSSRNVLEYFKPENFKAIEMHYGEKPKSLDCSKLTEKLQSELNDAKNTIETKDAEIRELDKKLRECYTEKSANLGDQVGKKFAELLSKRKNKSAAAGGKRRTHRK